MNNDKTKGMRKLDVDGQTWHFKVGRSAVVFLRPDGKKHVVSIVDVVPGLTWNTFERGQWKKTQDGMIRPGQVCDYIRKYRKENGLA